MDFDLIVVGSGFGGSVCARRAAEAGLRVVVLERGAVVDDAAYEDLAEGRRPLVHRADKPGLIEVHRGRGLLAVAGNAIGGGSHVYTAVTIPARSEVFERGWPGGISAESMAPYYERVTEAIRPTTLPRPSDRMIALQRIAAGVGGVMMPLPLAMDWAEVSEAPGETLRGRLVQWIRGGRRQRKRTLDRTYLAAARSAGAEVRGLHEATGIVPLEGGYRVLLRRWGDQRWRDDSLSALRVVLAMGTLHTVRMLLECRDGDRTLPKLSAALGRRFFTNGDEGGVVLGGKHIPDADDGPPVTGWIDCWRRDRLYVMETGVLDGFIPGMDGRRGRAWSFGVMGFEESSGALALDSRGRLIHTFDGLERGEFHARALRRLREVAEAAGGRLIASPAFLRRRLAVTVHPLGGAAMADGAERGVADARGEVFGYPGLFVADGSILPTPTGAPPSMTIAAVAERIAEGIADE